MRGAPFGALTVIGRGAIFPPCPLGVVVVVVVCVFGYFLVVPIVGSAK